MFGVSGMCWCTDNESVELAPPTVPELEVAPGAAIMFIGGQSGVDESGSLVGDSALSQSAQALKNVRTAVEAVG